MFENANRSEISQLGEFGLIKHLTKEITLNHKESILGVGDDAAILQFDADKQQVITTDLLLEGIHFDLSYVPLKHLGYKSVAVNLSDVCAMNAIPKQITVSLGISSRFSLEAVEELWEGIKIACKKYSIDIIGGDTSSSGKGLVISITCIGEAKPEKIVKRSGAKENDLLCVSGDLGAAYMGLQLLEREKKVFLENPNIQPDLEGKDYIIERQLKPEPQVELIKEMEEYGLVPTSMIDISDGLASEVFHLSEKSNVAFSVYEDKLPIDPMTYNTAVDFGIDPLTAMLNGGEDYELLFTVPQADVEKVQKIGGIKIIGFATDINEGNHIISKQNQKHPLKAQGWNAFS
jgi:thiamine-monophosphate kinase